MKRFIKTLYAVIGAISIMSTTAFAGQWVENGGQWFYMTDNGKYAKDIWLWLDENHDTYAELYHFDANGVMSQSTTVMDGSGTSYMLVNVDNNGAALNCTLAEGSSTDYEMIGNQAFPANYSVRLNSKGGYDYSLDVDHYDFEEVKDAKINGSFKKSGDCYLADVSLCIFYMSDSRMVTFNRFIDTTAKFSKNCKVRSYDNNDGVPISDYYKKQNRNNWLEVYSVDSDGYITDCMIYTAG